MDMIDWDRLRVFHAVAQIGSLTHAGDLLNLSQSAVSRQIRNLEIALNATLFRRHARGLILTEQGELLYDATKQMDLHLGNATARIRDSKDEAGGELRVTTTVGFGTLWLAPRLGRLYEAHPKMAIDLILKERVLDLPMREADLAIRMKEPSQADLIRRRLMDVNIRYYATPAYLAEFGTPQKAADLREHRLIAQRQSEVQVAAGAAFVEPFLQERDQRVLYINSYYGIFQMALLGLGIGALPNYLAVDHPEITRVLPEEESQPIPVYLAYPEELRDSMRVKVFRDFVLDEIGEYRQKLIE